jgi:hypothetical protein
MKLVLVVTCLIGPVAAFAPLSPTRTSTTTQLHESFGLNFAEDTYKNQPDLLKGEAEYKQFINKYAENNMLNRKVRSMNFFSYKKASKLHFSHGFLPSKKSTMLWAESVN